MAFSILTLVLLASSAAPRSEAASASGVDDTSSDDLYYTCLANSDCSNGNICLEVQTDVAVALQGAADCPLQSICVCAQEREEKDTRIEGDIEISVSSPVVFVNDPRAKVAMASAVAKIAAVPASLVSVTMKLKMTVNRRMAEEGQHDMFRRLAGLGSVVVSYTIAFPAVGEARVPAEQIGKVKSALSAAGGDTAGATGVLTEAMAAEAIGDAYTVTVLAVSEPIVIGDSAPSTTPSTVDGASASADATLALVAMTTVLCAMVAQIS